jgi:hypothetical protein
MFALSAVAVEREMVGKDSEGELIDGKEYVALAGKLQPAGQPLQSGRPLFDFGEEKYCTKRVGLRQLAREERVTLSPTAGETEVVVVLLAKGFENRRGIVSVL